MKYDLSREIVIAVAAILFFSGLDVYLKSKEKAESKNYCEMVQINKVSEGDFGWPDYKGHDQCGVEVSK